MTDRRRAAAWGICSMGHACARRAARCGSGPAAARIARTAARECQGDGSTASPPRSLPHSRKQGRCGGEARRSVAKAIKGAGRHHCLRASGTGARLAKERAGLLADLGEKQVVAVELLAACSGWNRIRHPPSSSNPMTFLAAQLRGALLMAAPSFPNSATRRTCWWPNSTVEAAGGTIEARKTEVAGEIAGLSRSQDLAGLADRKKALVSKEQRRSRERTEAHRGAGDKAKSLKQLLDDWPSSASAGRRKKPRGLPLRKRKRKRQEDLRAGRRWSSRMRRGKLGFPAQGLVVRRFGEGRWPGRQGARS